MKKNISIKLILVIGSLLILTLVIGLVAYFQTEYVNKKIKQIADVDHNTSITAYQMEINVTGMSFAVLRYLHEHDQDLLPVMKNEEDDFNIFQDNYRNILKQTDQIKKLGSQVSKAHSEFIIISKQLIKWEDLQTEKIEELQKNLADLNQFLEDKIQDSIKLFDLNKYKKLKAALKMQVNANYINKNLENYLRTHQTKYEKSILYNQHEFNDHFNLYLSYTHSEKKQQWMAIAKKKYNQVVHLSKNIIGIEHTKQNYLKQFETVQKELVVLLEKQILFLAQRDLINAKDDALAASEKSIALINYILVLGLLFGGTTSFFFARHITRSIKQLSTLTDAVANEDFTQKVNFQSEDEFGRLGASFNIMIDKLSEAKRAQMLLLSQLQKSNSELDDFAYIVSHDLKAPLRAINSIAEWVVTDYNDKLDDSGKEQLGLLRNRIKRMQDLIDGILRYSRIARKGELKETIDSRKLVKDILLLINPPKHIQINISEHMPQINCDIVRTEQVFMNLIQNAIKHLGKPQGTIDIKCTENENFYIFSIADNGVGIEEKNFARIFQLFQTLKPTDEKESTGIGLTIVKKIVENAGGEIWVESKVGEGTTFYFTLPK